MPNSAPSKLSPAVASAGISAPADSYRLHPLMWPLAAYLSVGTLLLFLVSQVDTIAASVMPWDAKPNKWHEGSAGWMAIFPITAPVLLAYAVTRTALALPARAIYTVGTAVRALARHVAHAWESVRGAIRRAREAMQRMLHDTLGAVRRGAELTVRRVRAALTRMTQRGRQ